MPDAPDARPSGPSPLRALVVDDEPLARAELRRLLRAHGDAAGGVEVVAEAESADAADVALDALADDGPSGGLPDVVFLDVQMPGRDGFAWLEDRSFSGRPVPPVVFVTAYDDHALRAFRASAVDYLLKPVEPERLADALGRVRRQRPAGAPAPQPGSEARPGTDRLGADDRVFVKDGEAVHLVRVGDVRLFTSAGNHTQLRFADGRGRDQRPFVLRSLSALEDRISPAVVARANRSEMVGLAHVVAVDEGVGGGLLATLSGGERVEFSRRRAQALRDRLAL